MIGLVIITHGNLGHEFIKVVEHVVGKQQQFNAVSIKPDDNIENRRDDILKAIDNIDSGDGVIALTDMFGGTPSNLAISILDQKNIEVLAGVNLPMLIKLVSLRQEPIKLAKAVEEARSAGRKYINVASQLLNND